MSREFVLDVAERAISTFVQAFAAVVVARQTVDSLTLKAALVAGGLAVAKGVAARGKGDPETASLLK